MSQVDRLFFFSFFRPNNQSSAYAQYPQQPGYPPSGAAYAGQTQNVVVVPAYRSPWANVVLTPLTPNLKIFLVLSGLFCILSGIADAALEVAIIINSYSSYYRGLWGGGYLIGTGIVMLVASCRPAFNMNALIRTFAIALVFVVIGLILSIVSYALTVACDSYTYYYCDDTLSMQLKAAILGVFAISLVHIIANIIVVIKAQSQAVVATRQPATGF